MSKASANDRDEGEALLKRVEADLSRSWSRIAFGPDIETRYQSAIEAARTRHYILCHLSGMAIFDLFAFIDALVIPDVLTLTFVLDFAVLTPTLLLLVWLMHRQVVPTVLGSTIFLFPMLLTMLALMLSSRAPNAVMVAFAMPMIPVYACIALPLPVFQAGIVVVGTLVLTTVAIVIHPRFDLGGALYAIMLNVSMAAYSLVAAYRNEISERRFYLLALREALRSERLSERNEELLSLSDTDGLTGVGNRRAFDIRLDDLWRDGGRMETAVALLMIDIDHFKRLNDTYGHLGGDRCLRAVANLIARTVHVPADATFRYGGEEFAVLLNGAGAGQATLIAERIRAAAAGAGSGEEFPGWAALTVSVGCATLVPDMSRPSSTLISIADAALYLAKQKGRNRVEVGRLHQPEPDLQVA